MGPPLESITSGEISAGITVASGPGCGWVAGAYHEFELNKLRLALANKDYNIEKHRNDLFDSEQLVYMKDPALHFLTADRGYLRKVVKSPYRDRIHEVPSQLLADPDKLEMMLRQIVLPAVLPTH